MFLKDRLGCCERQSVGTGRRWRDWCWCPGQMAEEVASSGECERFRLENWQNPMAWMRERVCGVQRAGERLIMAVTTGVPRFPAQLYWVFSTWGVKQCPETWPCDKSLDSLLTGLLVLHWEANGSSSWGFNASVGSARCGSGGPGSCPVPQECVPQDGVTGAGLCQCPQGWAGPHCRMALCPENCNAHNGAGTCNQVRVGEGKPGGTGAVVRALPEPLSAVPPEPGCVHLC